MLDRILASVSMLALIAFMGWVCVRVMEPDLWLVSIAILAIAVIFVREELLAGGSHLENEPAAGQQDT